MYEATETYMSSLTDLLIATKQGAIVGGQTSCKAPEISAFEKHLPADVDIVSCHSLHGPNVDPRGQPLVSRALLPVLPFF
jgi:prephenate dehydrogenase